MSNRHKRAADEALPLARFLTFRLARAQARLNAQAADVLRGTCGLGLTQWRILALLGAIGDASPSRLAQEGALDKGLLSRNLKQLAADGLVTLAADGRDHRRQIVSLSEEGVAVYGKMLPIMRSRQRYLMLALDEGERDALFSALDKLAAAAERREFEP